MPNRHRLDRSAVNHGRIHKEGLTALYRELPEAFKMSEAKDIVDWSQGTFLKLEQAGLLENEYVGRTEPKDWSLTQQAKRWLESELSAAD